MSLYGFLLQLLALNFFERMKSTTFLITYMEAIQYPQSPLLPFYKALVSTLHLSMREDQNCSCYSAVDEP